MLTHADIKRAVGSKFFRVVFVKRTDGSIREMRAKLGVTKHLSGGGAKYSFANNNLLSVWDVGVRAYRCVPLDAILELSCGKMALMTNGRIEEVANQTCAEPFADGPAPALYTPANIAPPAH